MADSKFTEDVRQHLSFIQGVITRMNSNSFSMKGWMVALVAALCAMFASNSSQSFDYVFFIIAIPIVLVFWFLDAYYLKKERQYRDLYNEVVSKKTRPILKWTPVNSNRASVTPCSPNPIARYTPSPLFFLYWLSSFQLNDLYNH